MTSRKRKIWRWQDLDVAWTKEGNHKSSHPSILLIHGFGACKEHWRHNQPVLGELTSCYSIDLIGFGESSQPKARLQGDAPQTGPITILR